MSYKLWPALLRSLFKFIAAVALLSSQQGCKEPDAINLSEKATNETAALSLASAAKPNSTLPDWIEPRSNPPAKHAIVFIHGLFGDTRGTWTNGHGTSFFDLLRSSAVGGQFDIYAFGYTSNELKPGSLNLVEATAMLDQYLSFHKVLNYGSITFVGHSMGGLVILNYLIHNENVRRKVNLVTLYATPQEGAQIAVIGDKVARNPALVQLLPMESNAFLQQLDADWKQIPERKRPFVACGYETKPLLGVTIVPFGSATRFCSGQAMPIQNADHLEVAKPDGPEHPSVVLLVNSLQKYVVSPSAGERKLDLNVAFKQWSQISNLPPPPALELVIEEPELQGPFGLSATTAAGGLEYRHHKFLLPPTGERLRGYITRSLYSAQSVHADGPPIKTRMCVQVTGAPMPSDGNAAINCVEGDLCSPRESNGPLAACSGTELGHSGLKWLDWLPLPAVNAAALGEPEPVPGDWIVPRLETLQSERLTSRGVGFSEVVLSIDNLEADGADAVTFEAEMNGHRLWVNALPTWALAQPLSSGRPATVTFGVENLNSAGAYDGGEKLKVRVLLLKNKRPVAEDSVLVDFQALRSIETRISRSQGNRLARWSATYFPGAQDQFQIFATGGSKAAIVHARQKLDDAKAQGSNALPLRGVVRPPLKANPNWGLSVGALQSNGQIRFSFSHQDALSMCKTMMAEATRSKLGQSGFKPALFEVREIAYEKEDSRVKQRVPCEKFLAI